MSMSFENNVSFFIAQLPTAANNFTCVCKADYVREDGKKISSYGTAVAANSNSCDTNQVISTAINNAQNALRNDMENTDSVSVQAAASNPVSTPAANQYQGMSSFAVSQQEKAKWNGGGDKPASFKQKQLLEEQFSIRGLNLESYVQENLKTTVAHLTGSQANALIRQVINQ